jgi:hypothetical protein
MRSLYWVCACLPPLLVNGWIITFRRQRIHMQQRKNCWARCFPAVRVVSNSIRYSICSERNVGECVGGGGQLNKCRLLWPPVEREEWPVVVKLVSSKGRSHFKTRKTLERTETWAWVPTGPETGIACVGEGQQQISRPTNGNVFD